MKKYTTSLIIHRTVAIIVSLIITVLSGCATTPNGHKFTQLKELSTPNDSQIYLYRSKEESWNVKGKEFRISINGEEVGTLPYGGYFIRTVQPGGTVIMTDSNAGWTNLVVYIVDKVTKEPGRVDVDLVAGETLFVKLKATDEFWHIAGNLSVVDRDTALKELSNTNLIKNEE